MSNMVKSRLGEDIFRWWREQGSPSPLLLSENEVATSTDCFPIEFHDINALLGDLDYARAALTGLECVVANIGPHAQYYFWLREKLGLDYRIVRDVRTAIWSSYLFQEHLLAPLLRPGGLLVYSVCTLTRAESVGIDEHVEATHPALEPVRAPGPPWLPLGRGALLLPQAAGTDGMYVLRLRAPK